VKTVGIGDDVATWSRWRGAARATELEVRFGNADGQLGVLYVDVYDSGDPEDAGLTVGLRGWRLADSVASV
jgi:hypothetical protein